MNVRIDMERLEGLVEETVLSTGFLLVEVKLGGSSKRPILRVFIYSPEGVGVEDCARVSRELGADLDKSELFPLNYVLEVSSPGADRVLQERKEYEIFRGRQVRLEIRNGSEGARTVVGTLGGIVDDVVSLDTIDDGEVKVLLRDIRKARLYMDYTKISKGKVDEF
jgi:ribosome maturation factor RimP